MIFQMRFFLFSLVFSTEKGIIDYKVIGLNLNKTFKEVIHIYIKMYVAIKI